MIKKTLILLSLLLFMISFCQNNIYVYELTYKPNVSTFDVAKETFLLDVNGDESMFRSYKDKKADSIAQTDNGYSLMTTSFKDFKSVSKDFKQKEVNKYISNFQNVFTLKVDWNIKWKIEEGGKTTLGMKSQKATTNYGGRKWTAWFTKEIKSQDGPYVFHGLPGLITEIYDEQNEYKFSLIQIRYATGKWYTKKKETPITWYEYYKLAVDDTDLTNDINDKKSPVRLLKWLDENGNEYKPDFKKMILKEQKENRYNNNVIELMMND